eukprot:CAMPEP_0118943280 /NCGR_PEP_ID=MMETSP1169-20130426/38008_1 /TAXON_ID=36882 /ORGANISM="Pyramimonas obovata, Strain CCMP722" /LENGTH=294 /DNA_ID=CAMNT_0006888499 /DNA_START=483 /DNA_END=1367 /DNA_ORIENTATION=-
MSVPVLEHTEDLYNGVIVNPEGLPNPEEEDNFISSLDASIAHWKAAGKRGIWLKVPTEKAALVGTAVKAGFEFHHAEPGYVMLTQWLPVEEASTIPSNASHQIGVGALVLNEKNEILVVLEKMGPAARPGFWKTPTGLVDQGEALASAVEREVAEETGVIAEFISVVGFRESHGVGMAKKSDLFFMCACRAIKSSIKIQESEIADAKWMPVEEWLALDVYNSSLYQQMCIWGVEAVKGEYVGLKPEEMTLGLRPGTLLVYHTAHEEGVKRPKVSRTDAAPECLKPEVLAKNPKL